jgi:hypothetical protein
MYLLPHSEHLNLGVFSGSISFWQMIVLPATEFDNLVGRPGYQLRDNGDLERREGSLTYVIVRQQSVQAALPIAEHGDDGGLPASEQNPYDK